MTVVSIANLKGGVGKSTLTMILGEFLAFHFGKKVLLMDLDSQANLSTMMLRGADINKQRENGHTIYHFFKEVMDERNPSITDFIAEPPLQVSNVAAGGRGRFHEGDLRGEGLRMVPSCPDFSQLDQDLLDLWKADKPYPRHLDGSLAGAWTQCTDRFDYVLIDCPPGLTVFTTMALVASNYFVSPVVPEPLAVRGVDLLQNRVAGLNQALADSGSAGKVEYAGAILNSVQSYRKTHQKYGDLIYGSREPGDPSDPVTRLRPFYWYVPLCEQLRKVSDFEELASEGAKPLFSSLHDEYRSSSLVSNPSGTKAFHRGPPDRYQLVERLIHLTQEFMDRCP